ncbi:MAG: hypothetical protein KDC26_07255 [Armatimonadetes bacterium]|nr:hypothetical protein [Armatimonadota bacterium]
MIRFAMLGFFPWILRAGILTIGAITAFYFLDRNMFQQLEEIERESQR